MTIACIASTAFVVRSLRRAVNASLSTNPSFANGVILVKTCFCFVVVDTAAAVVVVVVVVVSLTNDRGGCLLSLR